MICREYHGHYRSSRKSSLQFETMTSRQFLKSWFFSFQKYIITYRSKISMTFRWWRFWWFEKFFYSLEIIKEFWENYILDDIDTSSRWHCRHRRDIIDIMLWKEISFEISLHKLRDTNSEMKNEDFYKWRLVQHIQNYIRENEIVFRLF